jgi:hypothetical protein
VKARVRFKIFLSAIGFSRLSRYWKVVLTFEIQLAALLTSAQKAHSAFERC